MQTITNEVRELLIANVPKKCRLTFYLNDTNMIVRENKIITDTFVIDRTCVAGENIEIGTMIASQLSVKLRNLDGEFDDVTFEGVEVYVEIGVDDKWIPCGYFTVDTPPRKMTSITIEALDRMIRFDTTRDINTISYPITVRNLIIKACDVCGVPLRSNLDGLPNINMSLEYPYRDDFREESTWRNIMQSLLMLIGCNGLINSQGELEIKWFGDTPNEVITEHERYSRDIYENAITITGVQATYSTESHLIGTKDYVIDIGSCYYVRDENVETVLTALSSHLIGFSYVPYTITCRPFPHLYPLDVLQIKYGETTVNSIITNTLIQLNNAMTISAKGQSKSYNKLGSDTLTVVQSQIIEKVKEGLRDYVNGKTLNQDNFSKMISNGIGLNKIVYNGKDYLCDGTTLSDSNVIYTINSNGFAWTDNWNDGSPVWNYGVTKDGNAILNYLTVNKLSADQIDTENLYTSKFKAHSEGEGWTSDISMNDGSTQNTGFSVESNTNEEIDGVTHETSTYITTQWGSLSIDNASFEYIDDEQTNLNKSSFISTSMFIKAEVHSDKDESSIEIRDNSIRLKSSSEIVFETTPSIPWKNISNECIYPSDVLITTPVVMFDGHQIIVSFNSLFGINGTVTTLLTLPTKYSIAMGTKGTVSLATNIKGLNAIVNTNTIELINATTVATNQRIIGQIVVPINYTI